MRITVPADLTYSAEEVGNFLIKDTGTKFDGNNNVGLYFRRGFFHKVVYEVLKTG